MTRACGTKLTLKKCRPAAVQGLPPLPAGPTGPALPQGPPPPMGFPPHTSPLCSGPHMATQTETEAPLGSCKVSPTLSPQKPVEKPSRWSLCTTSREVGQPGWAAFSLTLLPASRKLSGFPKPGGRGPKVPCFVNLPFTHSSGHLAAGVPQCFSKAPTAKRAQTQHKQK